ncbi:LysE family translocator [Paenarthrobacter sp. DKR-5]|uniref:LysE family translocator n=1 Tax=Paenarthrobacter sp. DKR-5 TaxID=2835535 RepID=UPI001BDDC587|nr:LysE family translocator [Paenarthrobacter sp. DKR-5]MBT1004072.1 LysE family translocator [Paenarthrobacter sp. DKR-5]
MTVSSALLSFAVIAGLLTIVPGLDTALVLRSAISRSRGYAFATALGINTGALIWGIAAAVGASALLAASETAYRILTLAGAAYMVWLGASMLWKTFRRAPGAPTSSATAATVPPTTRGDLLRAWLTGAGTNLLNPKVGVFYLAMIPQFIPTGVSPMLMGALLAGVHNVLGLAWFTLIILGTGFAARWLKNARSAKIIDRITGTVLIGFGIKLAAQPH